MSDVATTPTPLRRLTNRFRRAEPDRNRFTEAALERYKREGLDLAVRARWITMAVIGVLLVFLHPHADVFYYHVILALLALNGWFMRRIGRVGRSRGELTLILADLVLMTVGMVLPNPFSPDDMPVAMQYRFDNFLYFFVILAAGTLAYSWRTVIAIGIWTSAIWTLGLIAALALSQPFAGLSEAAGALFGETSPRMARMLDPNSFDIHLRVQEIVVFALVAVTLGFSARRFNKLLLDSARLERERANLSRYFSPNVVDELSNNDDPLKQVRRQDVAVLFIDIVNFTGFSAHRDPDEVIEVLRGFHARMEAEVFRHDGTLDKYLGDGLMATFGTPLGGPHDATDALDCARAMIGAMDRWNREREFAGEEPIHAGIGVHHGAAVLGDIGANRLEFAVIGNAVNIASRLETLTRDHRARLLVSNDLRDRVIAESGPSAPGLRGLERRHDQQIRGIETPVTVWALT
jgi:adenylate cyclase